jgi:hypothetical protein
MRMQNQLESLQEEAHIKLSGFVTDLLGVSARRMLEALTDGENNPAALAAPADKRLRATPAQLCDALRACTESTGLSAVYQDGDARIAVPRAADRSTRPEDCESALPV